MEDITVRARKALKSIWKVAQLRGRCWGTKQEEGKNPFMGTNITMAHKNEVVTVSQENGILIIHEFKRTKEETLLGDAVRQSLEKENLPFK